MPTSRTESQAQTRLAILEAAYAEFSARAYSAVSLDDIAGRAGFSKGAIYANYTSKSDVLFACLTHRLDTVGDDYVAAMVGASDADLGGQIGDRAAKTEAGDLGYFRVLAAVWAEAVHDPEIAARLSKLRGEHRDRIESAIIERAGEAGIDLPVDARALAAGLTNMSMATMLEAATDPDFNSSEVHRVMADVALAGVLAMAQPQQ